jgi:trehalose synthase
VTPSLEAYRDVAPRGAVRLVEHLAEGLRGRSFLHVNSTRFGGGVAEILGRLIPLAHGVGVEARWEVIEGTPDFFAATKRLHNMLQGAPLSLTPGMKAAILGAAEDAARRMSLDADLVMIHDPQPAALVTSRRRRTPWVWRCHIDLSRPLHAAWSFLEPLVRRYDAAVFHLAAFAPPLPFPRYLIYPSIDPLSDKNRSLEPHEVERRVSALGVPLDRPIVLQVSRFDPFKDPVGVIRAFRLVRRYCDCVLVLAGGTAHDDPEGEAILAKVREEAHCDPDIHVLLLPSDAHLDINALQSAATVVVQKSLKEGFGLTVAEAMWKGKPVVGGAVGGITKQIEHLQTGYLVHSVEGCAYAVRHLLGNATERRRLGTLAREHARRHFLITRHLADYLQVMRLHARPA